MDIFWTYLVWSDLGSISNTYQLEILFYWNTNYVFEILLYMNKVFHTLFCILKLLYVLEILFCISIIFYIFEIHFVIEILITIIKKNFKFFYLKYFCTAKVWIWYEYRSIMKLAYGTPLDGPKTEKKIEMFLISHKTNLYCNTLLKVA